MSYLLPALFLFAFVSTVNSQCTGLDDPACPSWAANGYCTNTGHPMEERKKYCGVYCGFCNLDGSQTAAGGGDTLEPCDDAYANCVTWNNDPTNNFCSRTDYSSSMKLLYCCKTCRPYVLG
ncbi:hypothetical protein PRIPAC_80131 [Pristionchus pacificus]|uniref:ShK domain-containing protein n=1 Tax=Pristionchus pacificus TaxID=54126 RepID=A0A454XXV7_PRIPA|nr:hypothetical protein PRIPAC_80131 [Pristionchus pacificus]|eukprot:PDM72431.1 ShK domain-containing protein [Pristionchus pacificus]